MGKTLQSHTYQTYCSSRLCLSGKVLVLNTCFSQKCRKTCVSKRSQVKPVIFSTTLSYCLLSHKMKELSDLRWAAVLQTPPLCLKDEQSCSSQRHLTNESHKDRVPGLGECRDTRNALQQSVPLKQRRVIFFTQGLWVGPLLPLQVLPSLLLPLQPLSMVAFQFCFIMVAFQFCFIICLKMAAPALSIISIFRALMTEDKNKQYLVIVFRRQRLSKESCGRLLIRLFMLYTLDLKCPKSQWSPQLPIMALSGVGKT